MNTFVVDKRLIRENVEKEMGASLEEFLPKADRPGECSIKTTERLDDSGWAGKWTENIRDAVRRAVPAAECVCVKPLQFGKSVWYRVTVA